jgi:hypothetical protein
MDEYVCVTVVGGPGESASALTSRLYRFWTHMLRNRPADYERVYAEAREFEDEGGRPARRYMAEPGVVAALTAELAAHGLAHLPVDETDLYSKAEASSSEWFQLEH